MTGVTVECDRCSGVGYLQHYSHIAKGVCFACAGTGQLTQRPIPAATQTAKKAPAPGYARKAVTILGISGYVYKLPRAHAYSWFDQAVANPDWLGANFYVQDGQIKLQMLTLDAERRFLVDVFRRLPEATWVRWEETGDDRASIAVDKVLTAWRRDLVADLTRQLKPRPAKVSKPNA